MKSITNQQVLDAIKEIWDAGILLTYPEIAKHLPKNETTGKRYTREYIRQILRSFPAGQLIMSKIQSKNVRKPKHQRPPLIVDPIAFGSIEGDHIPTPLLTREDVVGRVVYGSIPLHLARHALFVIDRESNGTLYEYRVKTSNPVGSNGS